MRPWLLPLVPLYRVGVSLKNTAFDRGLLHQRSLQRPVVSIGSLSAGGAGKTPVVILLANLLQQHGLHADVLSRGYGRTAASPAQVRSADPQRFGDEPVEMFRTGLQVFVATRRIAAGLLAEANAPASVHLLDDGFQHRQLARSLDVVLLTLRDVQDHLLPAGNLREPLHALKRADVVVLREEEAPQLRPVVAAHTAAEVWIIRRKLHVAQRFARPFLFCGIARPEGFFSMVQDAGFPLAGTIAFPDHHPYIQADIVRILAAARQANADGFYFTQKDAVKLPSTWLRQLETLGPIHAPQLQVAILEPEAALRRLTLGLRT